METSPVVETPVSDPKKRGIRPLTEEERQKILAQFKALKEALRRLPKDERPASAEELDRIIGAAIPAS